MKKTIKNLLTCVLLLTFILSACTNTRFPSGIFQHTIFENFILELKNDGTWTYYIDREIIQSGTYAFEANLFTLRTENGGNGKESDPIVYEWTYENDILTLKHKGEECFPERFRSLSEFPLLINIGPLKFRDI